MMGAVTKPDIDLVGGEFWGANPHEGSDVGQLPESLAGTGH